MTRALSRVDPRVKFETMITIFIFILFWVHPGWPSWLLHGPCSGSTPYLDYKIMIIIISIFILTQVNSQPESWLGPGW